MLSPPSVISRSLSFQAYPQMVSGHPDVKMECESIFPIRCPRTFLSDELALFFEHGTLPESNPEQGKLFFECFTKLIQLKNGEANGSRDQILVALQFILNDITHLDFSLVHFENDALFVELCEFIGEHFKGNALSFCNKVEGDCKGYLRSGYMDAIAQLLNKKSNITSLSLEDWYIGFVGGSNFVGMVKGKHQLTELNLKGCHFAEYVFHDLASALQTNSTLRILNGGYFSQSGATLALFKNKTLTSLYFENSTTSGYNAPEYQLKLIAALEENTALISFDLERCDPIHRAQYDQILQRNLRLTLNDNYFQKFGLISIFNKEAELDVPREIYQLILNQITALIKSHQ